MSKSRESKAPLSGRRGIFEGNDVGSWEMTLLRMPGRSGPVDLDALVDRLIEREVAGSARRDIGEGLHAGRIATPAGNWGLLVALPSQAWAYLLPGFESHALPAEIARQAGLRVLQAGYQKTANATAFGCLEGEETLVEFASCGPIEEIVEAYTDPDDWEGKTLFAGSRLPANWIRSFESETEALEALAREFDAYVPCLGVRDVEGIVKLQGADRGKFRPRGYVRIDLIGFGDARLEPSDADRRLRTSIEAGDVAAVRAAAEAGADLRRLLGHDEPPLCVALRSKSPSRRELVAALVELGVDPHSPGQEQPVHVVLARSSDFQDEVIDLLELLTARGADVNSRGNRPGTSRRTPLHVTAGHRWRAVAKYLIAKGADVHATDADGQTPRQVAEADARKMREIIGDDKAAEYDEMIAFLADAEAGRALLDWRADAEETSRRERRRREEARREHNEGRDRISSLMKAAGLRRPGGHRPPGQATEGEPPS
jgi:hypothetical protein